MLPSVQDDFSAMHAELGWPDELAERSQRRTSSRGAPPECCSALERLQRRTKAQCTQLFNSAHSPTAFARRHTDCTRPPAVRLPAGVHAVACAFPSQLLCGAISPGGASTPEDTGTNSGRRRIGVEGGTPDVCRKLDTRHKCCEAWSVRGKNQNQRGDHLAHTIKQSCAAA
jgi:hypothetical protein